MIWWILIEREWSRLERVQNTCYWSKRKKREQWHSIWLRIINIFLLHFNMVLWRTVNWVICFNVQDNILTILWKVKPKWHHQQKRISLSLFFFCGGSCLGNLIIPLFLVKTKTAYNQYNINSKRNPNSLYK